jgi:hypothetical protein
MSKQHLRILAIAILAIAAIFAIAQAQTVLAQEEPLCEGAEPGWCIYHGCDDTGGNCAMLVPQDPDTCVCRYWPT